MAFGKAFVEQDAFFSVKTAVKIDGKKYVPAVCYLIATHLRATIEAMAKEGYARTYKDKVRFVSGAVVEDVQEKVASGPRKVYLEKPVPVEGAVQLLPEGIILSESDTDEDDGKVKDK